MTCASTSVPFAPEDDVALMKLYESLDVDARVSRFSSAYHPPSGFSRDLTTVGERGGARIVAVLQNDQPPAEDTFETPDAISATGVC